MTRGRAIARGDSLAVLREEVIACRRCPRLVAWREEVAREKRRAYRDETYWGRAVPGWGDATARLVIVGLAPGAHGANRTGRMFTGDASGEFLYAALHRAGLASQPVASAADDGLTLRDCWITASARCAPPDNKPTPSEFAACAPFLDREFALLAGARVYLALGAIAWSSVLGVASRAGWRAPRPKPAFGHGAELDLGTVLGGHRTLVGSYHVSRHNTQTGRLTRGMFDAVLARAGALTRATSPAC